MKIVAIGAHPDDYEMGAAMRLIYHVRMQDAVTGIICSYGDKAGDASIRAKEAIQAAEFIGIRELNIFPFEDTRFPDIGTIKDYLEEVILKVNPSLVYTHSPDDRHQDHRAVALATTIACRRIPSILTYHSPSTNPGSFQPHLFHVGSRDDFRKKRRVIEIYQSQINRQDGIYLKQMAIDARFYGSVISRYSHEPTYAEPFCANHFVLNCRDLICSG
jgi:LmbE family N-acetylglucosaminyl deacetylase